MDGEFQLMSHTIAQTWGKEQKLWPEWRTVEELTFLSGTDGGGRGRDPAGE